MTHKGGGGEKCRSILNTPRVLDGREKRNKRGKKKRRTGCMVTSTQEWPAATMAREVFVDHNVLDYRFNQQIKACTVSACSN